MTVEIENILKQIPNYDLLKDFESENYSISFEKRNKKILKFRDNKTSILLEDFWKSGIGRIKQKVFEKNHKHWFVQQYSNFSGLTIKSTKFDSSNFRDSKIILKNCRFENCEFYNISIMPLKLIENDKGDYTNLCYFDILNSVFINCKFSKINFLADSINKCSFYNCYEVKECRFGEYNNRSEIEDVNIYNCNLNNSNFYLILKNVNIFNSNFSNSSVKYCIFKECTIGDSTFTKCNFMSTEFSEKNFFRKSFFEENNFSGTDLRNIVFEENNSFKDNYYDITTKVENNYIEKYKLAYRFELNTFQHIADIHNNFYNEYKNTSMKDKAYEQYYTYKKITMIKYFPIESFQEIIYKIIFSQKMSKNLLMIPFLILLTSLSSQLILTIGKFSLAIIVFMIFFAILGGKFSSDFLSYIICGFGERPKRALIWVLCIIIGCAYLYMNTGIMVSIPGQGNYPIIYESIFTNSYLKNYSLVEVNACTFIKDYFRCLYFSVVTFTTIGFGDVLPITKWAKLLVMIEAILSILLINIFTATFIRKMIRD